MRFCFWSVRGRAGESSSLQEVLECWREVSGKLAFMVDVSYQFQLQPPLRHSTRFIGACYINAAQRFYRGKTAHYCLLSCEATRYSGFPDFGKEWESFRHCCNGDGGPQCQQ